jgi:hypothetical protein
LIEVSFLIERKSAERDAAVHAKRVLIDQTQVESAALPVHRLRP